MAGTGGARPGSGRKVKAEKYSGPIAAAEDRIAVRLPDLIDNLFVLADGVTVREPMPNGGERTYTKPPDYKANEYLLNRIMGKIPEVASGPNGIQVEVTLMALQQSGGEVAAWRRLMTERLLELTANPPSNGGPSTT